jgi:hypothetical protein
VLVVVVALDLLAVKKTRTTTITTTTTTHHENQCDITVSPSFRETPAPEFELLKKARGFQIVSVILSSLALDRERAD